MRRLLAIFTALALLLAMAVPASAKKGGEKDPPRNSQDFVGVTMALTSTNDVPNNGFATTCTGPLKMRVDNRGGMVAGGGDEVAALEVVADGFEWTRTFPPPNLGEGCHGGPSSLINIPDYGEPYENAGLLLISLDGPDPGLLWHLDYYSSAGTPPGKRNDRIIDLVREHFTIQSGDDFLWEPDPDPETDTGTISGTFAISYSLRDRVTGDVIYETPVTFDDAMYFEFTLTTNPLTQ